MFDYQHSVIKQWCQEFFGFQLPSVQIAKRTTKFEFQFQERSRPIKVVKNSNTSNLLQAVIADTIYVCWVRLVKL